MTSFILKIIACISMFMDHIGYIIFHKASFFNLIGRFAFPIFAFQISEGYSHTKDIKKYTIRLLIFALIAQIPFALFHSILAKGFALNVLFTLLLGLLSIICYEKISNKILSFLCVLFLAFIAQITHTDYGAFGVIIVFLFHVFKSNKLWMNFSFTFAVILKYAYSIYTYGFHYMYVLLALFTILSLVFINLYNGKQGKKIKYLLYIFYPAHLLLLYFLFFII